MQGAVVEIFPVDLPDVLAQLDFVSDVVAVLSTPLDAIVSHYGGELAVVVDELGESEMYGLYVGNRPLLLKRRRFSPVTSTQIIVNASQLGIEVYKSFVRDMDLLGAVSWFNQESAVWPNDPRQPPQ